MIPAYRKMNACRSPKTPVNFGPRGRSRSARSRASDLPVIHPRRCRRIRGNGLAWPRRYGVARGRCPWLAADARTRLRSARGVGAQVTRERNRATYRIYLRRTDRQAQRRALTGHGRRQGARATALKRTRSRWACSHSSFSKHALWAADPLCGPSDARRAEGGASLRRLPRTTWMG